MCILVYSIHIFIAAVCLRFQQVCISFRFTVFSIFNIEHVKNVEFMKLDGINNLMMAIQGHIVNGIVLENVNKPLLWEYVLSLYPKSWSFISLPLISRFLNFLSKYYHINSGFFFTHDHFLCHFSFLKSKKGFRRNHLNLDR